MVNTIRNIISKYVGNHRTCGDLDCNMMVLELHEPSAYKLLHKNYTTIKGGAKLAKKLTGYASIINMLKKRGDYTKIPNRFAVLGDIGVIHNSNCTFIHLGDSILNLKSDDDSGDEVFSIIKTNLIDTTTYDVYRRNTKWD